MPYIVKSSLDIGGKIIPWNEQEIEKLIKEKEKLEEKQAEQVSEQVNEQVSEQDVKVEENTSKEKQMPFKKNKRKDKVGEE